MENGDINVTIDEKYPQALGINGIMERVNIWGNSAWDIIVNEQWVERFLNKNRSYRVEPITTEIKTPTGYALVSTIRVKSTKSND